MNKEILYKNKKIFYSIYGSGKAVMLVHGFGETGTVWQNQIDFFKEKFLLIIPDLPGSGQSEMIKDMSMEELAEVLHSIIHEEDLNTCIMIGHSMGGYVTLSFAEKYWNHLERFGLVHSTAFADSDEKKFARKKGIEHIKKYGAFEFLKTTTPNLFSSNSKSELKQSIDSFIESLSVFSSEALIAYYEAMINRPERISVLKKSAQPLLLVAGEHDIAVTLEDILKQSHLAEITQFHILKKSGHMGMMEEPETLNNILDEFFLLTKTAF